MVCGPDNVKTAIEKWAFMGKPTNAHYHHYNNDTWVFPSPKIYCLIWSILGKYMKVIFL